MCSNNQTNHGPNCCKPEDFARCGCIEEETVTVTKAQLKQCADSLRQKVKQIDGYLKTNQ